MKGSTQGAPGIAFDEMSDPEPTEPSSGTAAPVAEGSEDRGRLWVDDAGVQRPFMRGIMIPSLMARGVPFEEANRVANTVRERLRPRGAVAQRAILGVLYPSVSP